ncbi:MAG: NlpC/P60 family protein [Chloroflexota bacterium]
MLTQIQDALTEIGQRFDARVEHCQVTALAQTGNLCTLTGEVLDEAMLTAVTGELNTRFPALDFDVSAVTRLRHADTPRKVVYTNLTGLHRQPSRTSEQFSQLLNGTVVSQLMVAGDWVYAQQMDGYLGWVNGRYLGEEMPLPATHLVSAPVSLLYANADEASPLVSRVIAGTAVAVTKQSGAWAYLALAGDKSGWVRQSDLRELAALPQDGNGRRQQIIQDSLPYIGVPYQWGGCSILGIDCSGLSQLLYKLIGITLPRDADMQLAAGKQIEPPFQPGDLLFFGSSRGHRTISHVGVSLGGWQIIHSSGPRNGVYEDDVQAVSWLRDTFVGASTFL